MAFTFKKEKQQTGIAAVGNPYPATTVKLNKKEVGLISPPNWQTKDNLWCVRLMVQSNDFCGWKWVSLKKKFESEPEAREFLQQNFDKLSKLNLHTIEDGV